MFCGRCGKQIPDDSSFCEGCGAKTGAAAIQTQAAQTADDNLVGWSPHIDNPIFRQHKQKQNKNLMITAFVVGAIEIVALGAYGYFGDAGENFIPLICVGCGLAVFTVVWALRRSYARRRKATEDWEGVVIDKRELRKRRKKYESKHDYTWQEYTVYQIVIQKQDGEYYSMSREDSFVYKNYAIGDRVRRHGFIDYLEKYDKRNSKYIFCAKCGNDCKPKLDFCNHCDAPLLKGARMQ